MSVDTNGKIKVIRLGLVLVCAAVHLFTPFNMAEGRTRWRYLCAYALEAVEFTVFNLSYLLQLYMWKFKKVFVCFVLRPFIL